MRSRAARRPRCSSVIVEIMNDDGTMARRPDLETFAQQHELKIGTIADLIRYRLRQERSVERIAEQQVTTEFGEFKLLAYEDHVHKDVHLALVRGTLDASQPPLVRVHPIDTLSDLIGAARCRPHLDAAPGDAAYRRGGHRHRHRAARPHARRVSSPTRWPRSGQRAGHVAPVHAPPQVLRTYGIGAQILKDLGRHAHAGAVGTQAAAGHRRVRPRDHRLRRGLTTAYTPAPMTGSLTGNSSLDASHRRVVIIAARFNAQLVDQLVDGATAAWAAHGGDPSRLLLERVPGAFELPLAAKMFAASGGVDAVVALGCVIRGDTPHFDYVAGECARGLMDAGLTTGVPVIFGVLTTETLAQAEERADVAAHEQGTRIDGGRARDDPTTRAAAQRAPRKKNPARGNADVARPRNQSGVGAPRRGAQARHAGVVSLAGQLRSLAGRAQRVRRRRRHAQGGSRLLQPAGHRRLRRQRSARYGARRRGWIANPRTSIRWSARCCGLARTNCARRPTCRIAWSSTKPSDSPNVSAPPTATSS